MCVKLENHLDLLTAQPQLLPLVFFHLPRVVLADPGGTCLLYSGAWNGFSPLANLAKTTVCVTALLQDTAAETQKWDSDAFWFLSSLNSPMCFLTSFFSLSCLQHQLKKFLGHRHLLCVLEVAGVFSLRQGEWDRNVCGWHDTEQRREKVQPCKALQGGNVCVGESERQGRGKIEGNENPMMLESGPGSCHAYEVPLSLLAIWGSEVS